MGWTRWNGDTTSKNKLFSQLVSAVAVLKGCVEFVIYKCWRIFDVILRLTSVILDHMQKRKKMEVNESLDEMDSIYVLVQTSAAEVSSFIIPKFSRCFSLFLMSQLMYKCVYVCVYIYLYLYLYLYIYNIIYSI